MIKFSAIAVSFSAFLNMMTCDQSRRNQCEWFLVPEKDYAENASIEKGFVPVCARNFESNKQHCPLQISLEDGKKTLGRKFRYIDMTLDKTGRFPRKVLKIEFCDGRQPHAFSAKS